MKRSKWIGRAGAALFWLAVWYFVSYRLSLRLSGSELLLPFPGTVLKRLSELIFTAAFWHTALATLARVFVSFVAAALIGSAAAVICAASRAVRCVIAPLMTVVRATPVVSFIVLLLLWVPSAGQISVWASVIMTAPIFWANLGRGIESVDGDLLEMAAVYRLGRAGTLRYVYLPSLKSALVSACENGVGLAWKAGVAAEVLVRPQFAIGRAIYESRLYLETSDLFAWTAVMVLLSLAVERGVKFLLRRFSDE